MDGRRLRITGIVQGVGFRPYIYRLATEHELRGEVWNSPGGVEILLQGPPEAIEGFIADLPVKQPPQADIRTIDVEPVSGLSYDDFTIRKSEASAGRGALAPPDLATCGDCRREMADPEDRRHRYPFINCVNCGPRFTIIESLPYDRPATTMSRFPMCQRCAAEYKDPANRRFHAQPNACPVCGPAVRLVKEGRAETGGDEAMRQAVAVLTGGGVLAVRGLGGYHLACDASSEQAVMRLRHAKERPGKPFAVMAASLDTLRDVVEIDDREEALLLSAQAPILLARKKDGAAAAKGVCEAVAPGRNRLGVFLPYTPLHRLLFDDAGIPFMVMTSGNRKDEPLSASPEEAERNLGGVADAFLHHNRPIHARCDDSVLAVTGRGPLLFRRARGYVPKAIDIPACRRPVLAMGGDLKSSLCLAAGKQAFVSQYLGDMEEEGVQEFFRSQAEHLSVLCRIEPAAVIHDLHPGYYSTQLAQEMAAALARKDAAPPGGLPLVAVQHHHAHAAAVMAEHGVPGPVIALTYDGAGYGRDGTIWGGEVLVADAAAFTRAGHLRPVPQPGGDAASRDCWRMALSYCADAWDGDLPDHVLPYASRGVESGAAEVVLRMIKSGFNAPQTSSCGRLFDAVACLAGVCARQTYEGEAACLLEAAVPAANLEEYSAYPVSMLEISDRFVLDTRPLIRAIVDDLLAGRETGGIAGSFHRWLVESSVEFCRRVQASTGLGQVALSGGVFQNILLTETLPPALEAAGFEVFTHRAVPPNDGCIALGQALIGAGGAVRCDLTGGAVRCGLRG